MSALSDPKQALSFYCVHEAYPDVTPESNLLFTYARWLQRNNELARDEEIDVEVERLYRIAAEYDHPKANVNLQYGGLQGLFKLRSEEYLRLSERLIKAGVAQGYYLIGIYLQRGGVGLKGDPEMALRYFRKAADEGNASAQAYVGDKLAPVDRAPDVARAMRLCAAAQGHGEAAMLAALDFQIEEQYHDALLAFQLGVKAGHSTSASFMSNGFRGPPKSDSLHFLGLSEDLERANRYQKIWRILANYSYAEPKVPEINDIVPLPPAPLPEWDGKLQWLEERLANIPPEKPSEELIKRLADEKLLEPATGRPMPGSAGFDASGFPLKACYSGDICPQTGYWQIMWLPYEARHQVDLRVTRHFKEGDVMPTHVAERYIVRHWPFSDKRTFTEEVVHWGLLG